MGTWVMEVKARGTCTHQALGLVLRTRWGAGEPGMSSPSSCAGSLLGDVGQPLPLAALTCTQGQSALSGSFLCGVWSFDLEVHAPAWSRDMSAKPSRPWK